MNFKKCLSMKSLLSLLCGTGFLLQTYQVCHQFMAGKTVVNLQMVRPESDNLPAITICYEDVLSFDKISPLNIEHKSLFDRYVRLIAEVNQLNRSDITSLLESHYENYKNVSQNYMNAYGLGYQHIFDMSFDIRGNGSDEYQSAIRVLLHDDYMQTVYDHFVRFQDDEGTYLLYNGIATESLWTEPYFQFKCFTFFSSFDGKGVTVKNTGHNKNMLIVEIETPWWWLPLPSYYLLSLFLHSTNELPDPRDSHITLRHGTTYSIGYFKTEAKLLKGNYELSCTEYATLDHPGDFYQRSDCIYSCVLDQYGPNCTNHVIENIKILFRRSELLIGNKHLCDSELKFNNVKAYCINEVCKPHCYQTSYYQEKMMTFNRGRKEIEAPSSLKSNLIEVELMPNGFPNLIIEYVPETTFISLVCSLGGLLGMWLGVSILAIADNFQQLFRGLFSSYIFNNYVFNNNYIDGSNSVINFIKTIKLRIKVPKESKRGNSVTRITH